MKTRFERWLSNPQTDRRLQQLADHIEALAASKSPESQSIVSRSKQCNSPLPVGGPQSRLPLRIHGWLSREVIKLLRDGGAPLVPRAIHVALVERYPEAGIKPAAVRGALYEAVRVRKPKIERVASGGYRAI